MMHSPRHDCPSTMFYAGIKWKLVVFILFQLTHKGSALRSPAGAENFKFTKMHYNVSIYENSVGKTNVMPETHMGVPVVDPDLDIRFRIIAGDESNYFKAEERPVGDFCFLMIRTRTNSFDVLNRERMDKYYLTIKAVGRYQGMGRALDTTATVLVRVLDRNDLKPLFYPTKYNVVIGENTRLHTSVIRVSASDADESINGEVYYSFFADTDMFAVHPTSGVVSLTRPIVYNEQNYFQLDIIAEDRGANLAGRGVSSPSIASLNVRVERVNEHAPDFSVETITDIPDSIPAGFVVAVVSVSDTDVGQNGELNKVHIIEDGDYKRFKLLQTRGSQYNLEVIKPLKRDSVPYYNLTLQAIDKGMPPQTSMTTVVVDMRGKDDEIPKFTESYAVRINESVPVGTPLLFVNASRNKDKKQKIEYAIADGNYNNMFSLDAKTGLLYTSAPLDREDVDRVILRVSAKDSRYIASATVAYAEVRIDVLDCNDNTPVFEIMEEPTVMENSPIGTDVSMIIAKDRDRGENGLVTYELVNSNPVPFSLDFKTGLLTTTKSLDYEKDRRNYKLVVRASDSGVPYRRAKETIIHVRLRDENDNKPIFERFKCHGYLAKNAPVGTQLAVVSAIDFDSGDIISYRIKSGNEDECFRLDGVMGQLSLACSMEDTDKNERSIAITASDRSHTTDPIFVNLTIVPAGRFRPDSATRHVAMTCQDNHATNSLHSLLEQVTSVNNEATIVDRTIQAQKQPENYNAPAFVSNIPNRLTILEDLPVGTSIAMFSAFDLDLQYNGLLVYTISSGNADSCFAVDIYTGDLKILSPLDRERRNEYTLGITVNDLGQPAKSASTSVTITIEDVNDCPPRFTLKIYEAKIGEDADTGTAVVRVEAIDDDLNQNARLTYSLVTETDDFAIDSRTGIVSVAQALDRERNPVYTLSVQAMDAGVPKALSSTTEVKVTVTDINDNAPTFLLPYHRIRVREDLPRRTVVTILTAMDPDLDDGGQVMYSFLDGTEGMFTIDSLTGVVRINDYLDYERQQVYNISALARDRGRPSLSSSCQIEIEVVDVNENLHTPRFEKFVAQGSVLENLPVGSSVLRVKATDKDVAEQDRTIVYSIRDGTGMGRFTVDNTGLIRTADVLDRESQSSYWLVVFAQDRGAVPRSSSIEVHVSVTDVNDNKPEAELPVYFPSVFENSDPGQEVVQIRAIDRDQDVAQSITYRISSGDPNSFFDIGRETGLIKTSRTGRKLDRERQSEHILEVTISDSGDPELTSKTRVVVSINDLNDNAPKFTERIYRVRILERREHSNEPLYRVVAFDKDTGVNGEIVYSLKGAEGRFEINARTGEISAKGKLEKRESFDLMVRAMDKGTPQRKATADIYVDILKRPRNSTADPEFLDVPQSIMVMETDPVGHLVWLVKGLQKDGNKLWYSIVDGNTDNKFTIDTERGIMTLARPLAPAAHKVYNLTVKLTDGFRSVSTVIKVQVHDVHESRPEFLKDVYEAELSESSDLGTTVVRVQAVDEDEGDSLFYTIYSAAQTASLSKFAIVSETGIITLREELDHEANDRHDLVVMVRDQGAPSKRNFCKVTIKVSDHNDHEPKFLSEEFQGSVYETAAVGTSVVQVLAYDDDKGSNAELKMSIISGNVDGTFTIDERFGIISVAKTLERSPQSSYKLLVKATDNGKPKLSGTVPVRIDITVSDNSPPRFDRDVYSTQVKENSPVGTHLTTVRAQSRASVVYRITDSSCPDAVFVNPNSGSVSTLVVFDYEVVKTCNITVQAVNMIGLENSAQVFIHIIDENDNRPEFMQNIYSVQVSEATPVGSVILTNNQEPLVVRALDNDTNLNALLKYRIVEEGAKATFRIGDSTGALITRTALDRELVSEYVFHIQVHDNGQPELEAETPARVVVRVGDVNDSPPTFSRTSYDVALVVPTYEGIIVAKVNAEDADVGPNARIKYSIVGGNENDVFKIDESRGIVSVVNEDLKHPRFNLRISASDGKFESFANIIVTLEESQESGIKFGQVEYNGSVMENVSEVVDVTQITIQGLSLEQHVVYKILNPNEYFQISRTSGVVRTSGRPCDRERQSRYKMIVEVEVIGQQRRKGRVVVNIEILDANDNAPEFVNQPYYAVVSVLAEPGTIVKQVTAIDSDLGENGRVVYSLVPDAETSSKFIINATNGAILLRKKLAKTDEKRQYILSVEARDEGTPYLQSSVIVPIMIMNQATPIFNRTFYTASVRENSRLGSALVTIQAKSPYGRKLIYSISKGDLFNEFDVDFTAGIITVAGILDYERLTTYELTLRATDTYSGVFAEVPVIVDIEDENDNAPVFTTDHYTTTVSEAISIGSSVLTVRAQDQDRGLNARLSYQILRSSNNNDSQYFSIDRDSGSVSLVRALDHERVSQLRFVVVATDNGLNPLNGSVEVTVEVTDMNDNAPKFNRESYDSVITDQASRGQFVTMVTATDADSTDQENLRYAIIDGDREHSFQIDAVTGAITLSQMRPPNLEAVYTLNVSVSDGVYTSFSSVRIVIQPSNRFSPRFEREVYTVRLKESVDIGTSVISLKAIDPDKASFGIVSYMIPSDLLQKYFTIDPSSGSVYTTKALDRETQDEFDIPVVGSDQGARTGFTTVRVLIEDVNDNEPRFTMGEYVANVYSDATVDTQVIKVRATDADKGDNGKLEYKIIGSNSTAMLEVFQVEEYTGTVRVSQPLGLLENRTVSFFISVSDRGDPPRAKSVAVRIFIMSPHVLAPQFTDATSAVAIPESIPIGSVLKKLLCPTNLTITYHLMSSGSTKAQPFEINAAGQISIKEALDREVESRFKLIVQAKSDTVPVLVDYAEVLIDVLDENDNTPTFDSDTYGISLAENAPVGSKVIQIRAKDPDSKSNSQIMYRLIDADLSVGNVFSVDEHSGWIRTLAKLDREKIENYTFQVMAVDNGVEPLSVSATVTISIADYNDETPTFSQNRYRGAVNEDALPGTVILTVETSDRDLGQNAKVSYYVVDGDPLGQFSMRDTGDLFVNRGLDRESHATYKLTVSATDGAHVSSATIDVLILDANDNAPVCEKPYYRVATPEDAANGAFVIQVHASDGDEVGTSNARIEYTLEGDGTRYFAIESDTGIIRTQKGLDRETTSAYSLFVKAADGGGLFCMSQVLIGVDDVNDNAPVFTNEQYTVAVLEDANQKTLLTRVSATDMDLGMNGKVSYSLTGVNSDHFDIDAVSGIVSVSKTLDREKQDKYSITVVSHDQGTPSQSATAQLIVILLDVNDNPPEFTQTLYVASVSETALPGTSLGAVRATSADVGVNAELGYAIVSGDERGVFKIDETTGMLYAVGLLDYETVREYSLTVEAADNGTPSLSASVKVVVNVTDENDNPPIFPVTKYTTKVSEDAVLQSKVVQVGALDQDSGRNAMLSYSIITGNDQGWFGVYPDSGIIFLNRALDRETVAVHEITVQASDSGVPVLTGTANVQVEVTDVNDCAPVFDQTNYTAILQEHRDAGRTLIQFNVRDDDLDPNAGPFTYDIIKGNELHKFLLDRNGKLVAAGHFVRELQDEYGLTVRAYDNGNPPLFTDTAVVIRVVEESFNVPVLETHYIVVNSYYDSFPGGVVGKLQGKDEDEHDELTYQLVSDYEDIFALDRKEGYVEVTSSLDVGSYVLNVSVTDGRFTSYGVVHIQVRAITDDMVENAVSIRFWNLTAEDFVSIYQTRLYDVMKNHMNIEPDNVLVIGMQARNRQRREAVPELDILLAVYGRRRQFVPKTVLRNKFLSSKDVLESSMKKNMLDVFYDICEPTTCDQGKCLSLLLFDEKALETVTTEFGSFAAPKYTITHMCDCKDHFGGERCENPLNQCARDPCPEYKVCQPQEAEGYRCVCPEGKSGPKCEESESTRTPDSPIAPMSFDGKSYVQWNVVDSIDRQLTISMAVRTLQKNGVLIYAGRLDRFILEMIDGLVQYRFDLGTGEGIAQVNYYVNDGRWHNIQVVRSLNTAELIIDNKYTAQAFALGRSSSMTIPENAVFFGAHVITSTFGPAQILQGFEGCMKDVMLNGASPPMKDSNSVAVMATMERVSMQCEEAVFNKGGCVNSPCLNGGTCRNRGPDFICICPAERYTGRRCEIDLNPCLANPCLNGGVCRNGYNEFFCQCTGRFSGKVCDYGYYCRPNPCLNGGTCREGRTSAVCDCTGYKGEYCEVDVDECKTLPCKNGGNCTNTPGAFKCTCPPEAGGTLCGELHLSSVTSTSFSITLSEIIGIVSVLLLMFIIVLISVCIVRTRRRREQRHRNANAERILNSTNNDPNRHKLSNLDAATSKLNPQMGNGAHEMCRSPTNIVIPPPSNSESANTLNNLDSAARYDGTFTRDYLQNINENIRKPGSEVSAQTANTKWDYPNIVDLDNVKGRKMEKALNSGVAESTMTVPESEYMDDGGDYHWDTTDWAVNPEHPGINRIPAKSVEKESNLSFDCRSSLVNGLPTGSEVMNGSEFDLESIPPKHYAVHPNSYLPTYLDNTGSGNLISNVDAESVDRLDYDAETRLTESHDELSHDGSLSEISNLCEIEDTDACITEDELEETHLLQPRQKET